VTDANLLLGRLEPTLGGKMKLDREAAHRVVAAIGKQVGLDPIAAAEGIVSICTENMAQAIRLALAERGRDPRDFAVASSGGAGGMHACWIARSLGIPTVIVPAYAGVASAYGATRMDLRHDLERFFYSPLASTDPAQVEQRYLALEEEGRALLSREGLDLAAVKIKRTAQMRYVGQSYEVLTPIPDRIGATLDEVRANFHKAHLREYGVFSEEFEPAIVSLGVTALGVVTRHELRDPGLRGANAKTSETRDAVKGHREVIFESKAMRSVLYDASALHPGLKVQGPAIIEHEHSCTVVPPECVASVDMEGNLSIRV
jgi:N-methylhydantoinase A